MSASHALVLEAPARLELIPRTPLSIEGATYLEQHDLTREDLTIE